MDFMRYVDELQRQLSTAAAAGGEEVREIAGRLTAPLDAAARLVLLEALSAAAGEISAELAPGSVDVRLRGGEPEFVVAAPAATAPTAVITGVTTGVTEHTATSALSPTPTGSAGTALADADAGATTRTTLRLPDHLKTQAEAAAARDGVSVNTWLVRAVAAALDQPTGRPAPQPGPGLPSGNRLTGWVR